MTTTVQQRLARAVAVLQPVMDVLEERAVEAEPPAFCERRGWTRFLGALDDRALAACEADGLAAHLAALPGAPPELVALGREATEAARLPAVERRRAVEPARLRAVPRRKQAQLAALLGAVEPMAERAARIVDVGAGSGHFTRLAAEAFDRAAVGLERRAERV
ncbi:MAG TPA: methyltransferase, partial [Polyangiaceae bacterium]|nr:methyltransferase [Polyangiaceae bacterium]